MHKDEIFNDFLSQQSIIWQFNLSRAPWWGGQFERLIGLMKAAFYKTVGQGLLTWEELTKVLLDIEVTLNNRPLSYLEEDVQLPKLLPVHQFQHTARTRAHHLDERDLRKRANFLLKTKDAMWGRWTSEYLRALPKRHRLKYGNAESSLAVGDVMIIKSVERNRNCWPLGIIEELIIGRDQVVCGAK